MLFVLGYMTGLLTAVLIAALLAYYKTPIERTMRQAETTLHNAGPRPHGFLLESDDEAAIAREEIVQRNAEQGRDTPISELQS